MSLGRTTLRAFSPLAKRILPNRAKRLLLLHALGARDRYAALRKAPSRLFLQDEIMPWVSRNCASVLFVGTGPYVYQFEKLFRSRHYMTIDPDPAVAVWGARRHVVGLVQDIGRYAAKSSFDCIIMNGVFGFGVNEPADMRGTIKALHEVLQPDGLLIVGWNTNLHDDPEGLEIYTPYFVPNDRPPFNGRRVFDLPETHVYGFYRRTA